MIFLLSGVLHSKFKKVKKKKMFEKDVLKKESSFVFY